MQVLDYVIIIAFAVAFVVGIVKGIVKLLFDIISFLLVFPISAKLAGIVEGWLTFIESESLRSAVSLIATFVVVSLVFALIAWLVRTLLHKSHTVGFVDRLIGAVAMVGVVYLVFAVLTSFMLGTADDFLALIKSCGLKDAFGGSIIIQRLYAKNPFGDWILNIIANSLQNIIPTP